MEINVLLCEIVAQDELTFNVLGVFDNEYIDYAKQKAKEKYPKGNIWYFTTDLNSIIHNNIIYS